MKQLKDDDLEKVTGGIDYEDDHKPSLEDDLPWWWKQPTGNNNNNSISDEGTPAW